MNINQAPSGGGSGGEIFLEAPNIDVAGTLAANGGGGGVWDTNGGAFSYQVASDALFANDLAAGNSEGSYYGGNGAYGTTPATAAKGGGGGGGVGRIWLRTHSRAASATGVLTPPASLDTSL